MRPPLTPKYRFTIAPNLISISYLLIVYAILLGKNIVSFALDLLRVRQLSRSKTVSLLATVLTLMLQRQSELVV